MGRGGISKKPGCGLGERKETEWEFTLQPLEVALVFRISGCTQQTGFARHKEPTQEGTGMWRKERGQHGLGRVGIGQEETSLETKQSLYGVVGGLPMGHMNFLEIHFLP